MTALRIGATKGNAAVLSLKCMLLVNLLERCCDSGQEAVHQYCDNLTEHFQLASHLIWHICEARNIVGLPLADAGLDEALPCPDKAAGRPHKLVCLKKQAQKLGCRSGEGRVPRDIAGKRWGHKVSRLRAKENKK